MLASCIPLFLCFMASSSSTDRPPAVSNIQGWHPQQVTTP